MTRRDTDRTRHRLGRAVPAAVFLLALAGPPAARPQGMFPAVENPYAARELARVLAPLGRLTPVSDDLLEHPPPSDWLMWRRTYDGAGFSPLNELTPANVGTLRLAWSWSMTGGPTESTPIVHDGILFIQNYGDSVDALDARTGDLLWRYEHPLPAPGIRGFKKAMAIRGQRLYLATSDHSLVALDVRTGKVAWEHKVGGEGMYTGGTMVAAGVVMAGTTACVTSRCFITGHDPDTGAELWRFYTVAASTEAGGATWAELPDNERFGGSVWTPGSYDPRTGLVYWGTGQPYPWNGAARGTNAPSHGVSNELLYTDNTLALDPRSGRLAWHYTHLPNDNWDMDYAFERQLIDLTTDGHERTLVVTTGKLGIIEALDRRTGRFAFAYDLGLQNIVRSIDPHTGAKTINPATVPTSDNTVEICPHPGGARSLGATSYDARTHILYVPLQEHCSLMTSVPRLPGEKTNFPKHVLKLRADSDGNLGRLVALDLTTGRPVWMHRERSPMSSAALATAGGVVFQGTFDRYFKAFDSASGALLWQVRLNDMPVSYPIAYAIDGHQYVAVATGAGNPYSNTWGNLVPEMKRPATSGAVLWVFRLPGADDLVTHRTEKASATSVGASGGGAAQVWESPAGAGARAHYAPAQATRGERLYGDRCALCHGAHLDDGQFGRALRGASFRRDWSGRSLGALGRFMQARMPPNGAGTLSAGDTTDLLAFLLAAGGLPPGTEPLPASPEGWDGLAVPGASPIDPEAPAP